MPEYCSAFYQPPVYYGDSVYDNWASYWENLARVNLDQYDFIKFWHDRWLFDERMSGGVLNIDNTNKSLHNKGHYPSWAPEKSIMIANNNSYKRI